jgi:NAD(P)-dependent dehydrogenase (short-subunit alcohol dehydrogenase family)
MAPLTNKKIVVVGGSSGIGFAVAKAALAEGASVVVCSSSQDKVNAAAQRLGAGLRVAAEVLNITDEADVKALFEKIGKFDHLVITVRRPRASSLTFMATHSRDGRRARAARSLTSGTLN